MLRRKIDDFLRNWHENQDRNPLVVYGARQVGKTTSILEFAKKNYESVVEVNFVINTAFKSIFKDGYAPDDVNYNISVVDFRNKFIPHKTLIFFDEVQDMPDAMTALKFYKLDGRYDCICSGSMLGINYKGIRSVAVGFKQDYVMRSLDFEEFLWANGYNDELTGRIYAKMLDARALSDVEFASLSKLFGQYVMVGGMPKNVQEFVLSRTLHEVVGAQRQLLLDYENDMKKYVQGLDVAKVVNYYRHITPMLARDNHKFQISRLSHGAKSRDYTGCDEWLKDAGIINIAYNLQDLSLPLKGNEIENDKRVYYADHSLLIASLDEESREDLSLNGNFEIYNGALTESIVSEALVKSGFEDLYFYRSKDMSVELDFVVRRKNMVVPIEVKTNRGRSKSLNKMLDAGMFEYGIKLTAQNIGFSDRKFTFPYFLAFKVKNFLHDKFAW